MTLFDSYYGDGLNAAIGVQHTNARSGGGLMALFDSSYGDGVNAAIGVMSGYEWLLVVLVCLRVVMSGSGVVTSGYE